MEVIVMLYSEKKQNKGTAFVISELQDGPSNTTKMDRQSEHPNETIEQFDLNIFQEIY
jgi:hypothetical protein